MCTKHVHEYGWDIPHRNPLSSKKEKEKMIASVTISTFLPGKCEVMTPPWLSVSAALLARGVLGPKPENSQSLAVVGSLYSFWDSSRNTIVHFGICSLLVIQ